MFWRNHLAFLFQVVFSGLCCVDKLPSLLVQRVFDNSTLLQDFLSFNMEPSSMKSAWITQEPPFFIFLHQFPFLLNPRNIVFMTGIGIYAAKENQTINDKHPSVNLQVLHREQSRGGWPN